MEIIERKENPVLDRVELTFQWNHSGEATPSLSQMVDAAAKAEPGADKKLVFVKNVNTRFGMSRTSGMALIYGAAEAASIEPDYVIERHKSLNENESKQKKAKETETDDSETEPQEAEEEGDA
ncbi:MAG: 30S ribosomal protein S24e [Euryarchaeota archaeon]|nr:30S ribosomal protein S24e [Euryarchaeota archaeon]|tara:strand:+ start:156 stop:524 length:369 start_codon:yes stop_codon:yes gene_type:complete